MNIADHERLLESVVRLTEKRARESLELCLMQTMYWSLISCGDLLFCYGGEGPLPPSDNPLPSTVLPPSTA